MKFLGYRRPDGKVGIRNKIFILPASVCASDTTRIIASQIEGAVTFNNQNGCSQVAGDQQLTMDVMAGMAANPNVYGIIVVSLGCENCQMDLVVDAIRERTNKPNIYNSRKWWNNHNNRKSSTCWKKNGSRSFYATKRRV